MLLTGRLLSIALLWTVCFARPWKEKHHVKDDNGNPKSSKQEKRGTIRIAGPWHSESALDRNIDPGEDSYVKKIISSNEGINFNKDIAEAGEVFDVNGIEDFYDKNAMITYEVNGHEIPVHMKPKYTPQSKSMFPEYVRESPETLGNTRQAKSSSHHSPSMNERPDGRPSTFTGLSVKDMPEYNVRDSSDLSGIKEEGIHGDNRHFYHELPPPLRLQKENPHTPSLDQLAAGHGISEETLSKLKLLSSKINAKNSQESEHTIGEYAAEYLRKKLEKDETQAKPKHVELEIKESSEATERKPDLPATPTDLNLEQTSKLKEPLRQEAEPINKQVEASITEHHNTEASNPHEEQMNTFIKQEKTNKEEPSSEGKLYQKLQSLHEKLNEDNAALRESQQPHSDTVKDNEPEKAKAKAKILNLLGELTNKLKGMEAVVTGHHSDKETEKATNVETKTSFDGEKKSIDSESKNVEKVTHSQMESVRQEPVEEKTSARINSNHIKQVENSPLRIEDENFHLQDKRKKMEEYHRLTPADIYLYHHGKDPSQSSEKLNEDESARQPKISTEIIEKFSDQNKPFVMNTEAIDYKPEFTPSDRDTDVVSGQTTATLRSPKPQSRDKERSDVNELATKTSEKDERKYYGRPTEENQEGDDRNEGLSTQKSRMRHKEHEKNTENEESLKETSSERENENERKENNKSFEMSDNSQDSDRDRDYVAHEKSFKPKAEDIEYPDYNEVKDAAIFETNLLRKRYHASKLRWSDRLSDEAQKEAETLSRKSDLDYNKLDSYKKPGLNIALIKLDSPNVGKEATDLWEKEVKNYDFRSPLVTKKNSDFVQLMWKGGKEFGLGVAKSKAGRGWVVTSYFDTPYVDKFQELKSNLQSDVPIEDPYQDIAGK